jgi:hypothetical protein
LGYGAKVGESCALVLALRNSPTYTHKNIHKNTFKYPKTKNLEEDKLEHLGGKQSELPTGVATSAAGVEWIILKER